MNNKTPKVAKAMAEIEAIIKKYDLGAAIVLHGIEPLKEGFMGRRSQWIKISPSYSALETNNAGEMVIKHGPPEFASEEEQIAAMTFTRDMLEYLSEATRELADEFLTALQSLDEFNGHTNPKWDETSN
jgi:hypothetical protein